ncbi:hypothetical protein K503DRAFT_773477, partial [Rhizopogon vinicolor AM-OR11-026]
IVLSQLNVACRSPCGKAAVHKLIIDDPCNVIGMLVSAISKYSPAVLYGYCI